MVFLFSIVITDTISEIVALILMIFDRKTYSTEPPGHIANGSLLIIIVAGTLVSLIIMYFRTQPLW